MQQKVVPFERYVELMRKHKSKLYNLELDGWEVPVLQGLILLASRHPSLAKPGEPTRRVINEVKLWCRQVLLGWGYSAAEIEYLEHGEVKIPAGVPDVRD